MINMTRCTQNVTVSRAHAIGGVSLHGNVVTHCSRFFRPNSVIGVLPTYREGRVALTVVGVQLCVDNSIVTLPHLTQYSPLFKAETFTVTMT